VGSVRIGVVLVGGEEGAVGVWALEEGMSKDFKSCAMSDWVMESAVGGLSKVDVMSVVVEGGGGSR